MGCHIYHIYVCHSYTTYIPVDRCTDIRWDVTCHIYVCDTYITYIPCAIRTPIDFRLHICIIHRILYILIIYFIHSMHYTYVILRVCGRWIYFFFIVWMRREYMCIYICIMHSIMHVSYKVCSIHMSCCMYAGVGYIVWMQRVYMYIQRYICHMECLKYVLQSMQTQTQTQAQTQIQTQTQTQTRTPTQTKTQT